MSERVWWAALLLLAARASGEILTPPYFNLAAGRNITATATCGDEGRELYCKLVGANAENDDTVNVIQGQVCDYCDMKGAGKMHPPENAVDGMETWWQSPPLSRGMKYNEVNLTIDLGQEFHVAYVFVRMGNSPRPGLWALEKSSDYGKTYKPWQYFSDSTSDCETYFGKESLLKITRDDSVICSTEYSKIVPLEGGEIPISLLTDRPSANMYFNSSVLQEWTRATNVRLRLLRTKNLLGHLMFVARQDPTVTRRYFYSIKDVSIGGRCMCNGHADTCDIPDAVNQNKLLCRCQHNTCGPQCAQCCHGFEQKAWRQSQVWQKFVCESCNCFNHSNECSYDADIDAQGLSLDIHGNYEGGGICKNCQHNTEGINCNRCKSKFYRPYGKHLNETDVCSACNCNVHYSTGNCADGSGQCECRKEFQEPHCKTCSYGYFDYPNCKPCTCNLNGTRGDHCEPSNDRCPCKDNYQGLYCEQCADGFYNFPECKECSCNSLGAYTPTCDQQSGNCTCKSNFGGRTCDRCEAGYYSYPACNFCNCDTSGTLKSICNSTTGSCLCKEGFGGSRCDQCLPSYYSELQQRDRVCVECKCSTIGSTTTSCDATGKCTCLDNFAGKQCDQCSPGYYNYPECLSCNCDSFGSIGVTCDKDGQCQCKNNFDQAQCNTCKDGFYNFPACEECNCDPVGVIASFEGCGSVPEGHLCECKERVQGRICNECKDLYWNLKQYNVEGCEGCNCHLPGTQGGIGVCNTKSGQCACKYSVGDRDCGECKDGSFNLTEENIFGCTNCGCDVGGSVNNNCDKETGQCTCRPRIEGLKCNKPLQAHYFPTLHQYQYEAEDATTPAGKMRYGFSEKDFPGFSSKGYAVFSLLQNEIIQTLHINKPSVYRMVMRYVNPGLDSIIANIIITPDNPSDNEQKFDILLKPTMHPQFVSVVGAQGVTLVMNPGIWAVNIKSDKSLFLDYFALVPAAYYEATILTQSIDNVCTIGDKGLCRHFGYPNITPFDSVQGAGGFTPRDGERSHLMEFITYHQQLVELDEPEIPLINQKQEELLLDLMVSKTGPHVMLIEYVTPIQNQEMDGGKITVTARGKVSQEGAKVNFNNCPYTTICRQVLTDENSKVQVFNIQDNFVKLSLKGDSKTSVGIKSVVVIPYQQWHLNYVNPQPVCVRKNGKCLQTDFPIAPDSKKVEFESEPETISTVRPWNIYDNNTNLVYLNPESTHVDVNSKVPFPGQYVFIVHYYQPDFPESNMEVLIQNGQIYQAKLTTKHCPLNAGCRSVVQAQDGNNRFTLNENFLLTLRDTAGQGVWLDYLLIVPADQYTESLLKENRLDQTREFISTCGSNHFFVNVSSEGFCRDAVFSLTTENNNGASPCNCHYLGSKSFECETFGGQCECKPNVIGRTCEICRTGYYGFPDCKPCSCPSTAQCQRDTGECICPTGVTGEKCDQCKPLTYGYDPSIGCEECDCHHLGVENNQHQCNLLTGSCNCKRDVVGRKCNQCNAGHYHFPYCKRCGCNTKGTTPDICDSDTSDCFCKANVEGDQCDSCIDGTFDLQNDNKAGCTKCFCFGKTTRCSSAKLWWYKIIGMNNWFLANIAVKENVTIFKHINPPQPLNKSVIGVELLGDESLNQYVYFGAPPDYLGNKITSYGGSITYSIFYTSGDFGEALSQGDLILEGANMYLIHSGIEQPSANIIWSNKVLLTESEFVTVTNLPATRELLMTVLEDLTGIYIRANYWQDSIISRLQDVSLETGIDFWEEESLQASSVEQCQCPVNYAGYSCEKCAEGFYRVQSGPHGGYCVACQCNGHASSCDVNTGACKDCQHNTTGEHCEQCIIGYHGNASKGTPNDCLICACPLPIASNNFATGCYVSDDGYHTSCDCMPGYFGARCESCDSGFFGKPQIEGEICTPCECSGNINPEDSESCDTITGDCLKCMNNTFGAACSLCQPGFYGDAIYLKNCQVCLCDGSGMDKCDSSTGFCECKKGVIGVKCDRCEDEHWGFDSGKGCTSCNCSIASHSKQCDDSTGQCKCKPGVTGKNCDKCAPGYWNYTPNGCVTCGCNTNYSLGFGCNAATGHCECLPRAIGDKCDRCPYRNVLIKDTGCSECDLCIHSLLNSTDNLQHLIDPVMTDFENKASGYFTAQRLVYISNKIDNLAPAVKALDPNIIDLKPATNKIDNLDNKTKILDRKAEFGATDAENLKINAGDLLDRSKKVYEDIQLGSINSKASVDHVFQLANSLENGESPRSDSSLAEAKQILSDIKAKDITPQFNASQEALQESNNLIEKMQHFVEPVKNQTQTFQDLHNQLVYLTKNLKEMLNYTKSTASKADTSDQLNKKNREAQNNSKIQTVISQQKESQKDLKMASKFLIDATFALAATKSGINVSREKLNDEFHLNQNVNQTIEERQSQMGDFQNLLDTSTAHVDMLLSQSSTLNDLLEKSKNNSQTEHAVRGASAYPDIVKEINASRDAAREAYDAAENATVLSQGLSSNVQPSQAQSAMLHQNALDSLTKVQRELEPNLKNAAKAVNDVKGLNQKSDDANNAIFKAISDVQQVSLDFINDVNKDSKNVNKTVENARKEMAPLLKDLPESLKQALELPKEVHDNEQKTALIKSQLDNVNRDNPEIRNLINEVKKKDNLFEKSKNKANENLDNLRKSILMAKDLANRIKVGVQFEPTTTLQLQPPDNVDELATSTHVSTYFKTAKENGFLMYLGNNIGTNLKKTEKDDFMALEIENGYPVLTMDIGSGPERIMSDKHVSDNIWYQVIVDRVGKNVKLTIREELPNDDEKLHVKEHVLQGQHSIFDLDKDQSKLFVGGYPAGYKVQDDIKFSSFEGQMEDLVIGYTPVGLWNFIEAQNTNGATERDLLKNENPTNGYRFEEDGYAIVNGSSYSIQETTVIQFNFKTFAPDGLLFLAGKGRSFLSIEMRNGNVYLQYRLGGQVLTIGSTNRFDDGQWHNLIATRQQKTGQLRIDNRIIAKDSADGDENMLHTTGYLHFGGYPNNDHGYVEVIKKSFDGCIGDVHILDTPVDLTQNIQAFGVIAGCPQKFARLLSFEENAGGYVKRPNTSVSNYFELSLKLKTTAKEGLIFYGANYDQSTRISLSMINGSFVAYSQKETLSSSPQTYNDGQWHVVTITHDNNALKIVVDDVDRFSTDNSPPPLHIMYGELYIGGVPLDYIIIPMGSATRKSFSGCLGDATINNHIISFANATDKNGRSLEKCSKDPKLAVIKGGSSMNVPLISETYNPPVTMHRPPKKNIPPIISEPDEDIRENDIKPNTDRIIPKPESLPYDPITHKPNVRPPPVYNQDCNNGYDPTKELGNPDDGYRFGTRIYSRIEFGQLPTRYNRDFDFSVEFNTTDEYGGLIFYASDGQHKDYVALYMKDGKIIYSYNCGTGPAVLTSQNVYSDGNWHSVIFSRERKNGKLIIDDDDSVHGESAGSSNSIKMEPPFYFGGFTNTTPSMLNNIQKSYSPFNGCLRKLQMSRKPVTDIKRAVHVHACNQQNEERGTFFSGHNGYIRLHYRILDQADIKISMDLKIRNSTGLIFSMHGKNDYIILQLEENAIVLKVGHKNIVDEAQYKIGTKHRLCDGNWHNVIVLKSANVLTIGVDETYGTATKGKHSNPLTTRPLMYIGGHHLWNINKQVRGTNLRQGFSGCIRNIMIGKELIDIPLEAAHGDVIVGMCPT